MWPTGAHFKILMCCVLDEMWHEEGVQLDYQVILMKLFWSL